MRNLILGTGLIILSLSFMFSIFLNSYIFILMFYLSLAIISLTLIILYENDFIYSGIILLLIIILSTLIQFFYNFILFLIYYIIFYLSFLCFIYNLKSYSRKHNFRLITNISFYGIILQMIDVIIYPYMGYKIYLDFENYSQYSGKFITPAGYNLTISLPSIVILISNFLIGIGFLIIAIQMMKNKIF
jgi:hypothetical protein